MMCAAHLIKKNETGSMCSGYGRRRGTRRVLMGNMMEGSNVKDIGIHGANIKMNLQEVAWGGGHGLD